MKHLLLLLAFPLAAVAAPSDRDLVAAVLVAEAGGEKRASVGMAAVWEVIHQRAINRRIGYAAVVRQRLQFSCLNRTTPDALVKRARGHARWREAGGIVGAVPQTNHTRGADHYHTRGVSPKWSRGVKPVAVVGGHLFFKLSK